MMALFSFADLKTFDFITIAAVILILLFLIMGLVKRRTGMCIIAGVLAAIFIVCQPATLDKIKTGLNSIIESGTNPLKDDDYSDMIGTDITDIAPNDRLDGIGGK